MINIVKYRNTEPINQRSAFLFVVISIAVLILAFVSRKARVQRAMEPDTKRGVQSGMDQIMQAKLPWVRSSTGEVCTPRWSGNNQILTCTPLLRRAMGNNLLFEERQARIRHNYWFPTSTNRQEAVDWRSGYGNQ